jgi:hypothetical protein
MTTLCVSQDQAMCPECHDTGWTENPAWVEWSYEIDAWEDFEDGHYDPTDGPPSVPIGYPDDCPDEPERYLGCVCGTKSGRQQ